MPNSRGRYARRNKTYAGKPTRYMRERKKREMKRFSQVMALGLIMGFVLNNANAEVYREDLLKAEVKTEQVGGEDIVILSAPSLDLTGAEFVGPLKEEPKKATVQPKESESEYEAKMFIYKKESGNNPSAINPSSGACGLGQALPCSKLKCGLKDYECQDKWFTNYMKERYGTWQKAKAFWLAHRYW